MSCHYAAAGGPRRACGVRSVGEAWHVLVKNSLQSHHLTTHHTPHTTHHTPHTLVCFIALPDSGERMHQVVEGRLHRSATLSGSDCTVGCSQPKLDFSLRQEDKLKVLKRAAGNNSVLHHSVLDWRDSPARGTFRTNYPPLFCGIHRVVATAQHPAIAQGSNRPAQRPASTTWTETTASQPWLPRA